MKTTLVLFDVDGTLIDAHGAGRRAMEHACRQVFGIDDIDRRASGVRYAGMTDPVILEDVSLAIGIAPARLAAERDALQRSYLEGLRLEMAREDRSRRVLPGVRPLLEALDVREDVRVGLVTGNLEEGARVKLEPFDLNRFFPGGGFSSDHRDRREIARIGWRKLCELAGIDFAAEHVVIVGDTEHDVDCARANGFRSVALASGWGAREHLERARPDVLLDDLQDQPRALEALGL